MYYEIRVVFFCKQKTSYEMRISDWSSDVCSSDLRQRDGGGRPAMAGLESHRNHAYLEIIYGKGMGFGRDQPLNPFGPGGYSRPGRAPSQIGRESCRERVGQYGENLVGDVALQKTT